MISHTFSFICGNQQLWGVIYDDLLHFGGNLWRSATLEGLHVVISHLLRLHVPEQMYGDQPPFAGYIQ